MLCDFDYRFEPDGPVVRIELDYVALWYDGPRETIAIEGFHVDGSGALSEQFWLRWIKDEELRDRTIEACRADWIQREPPDYDGEPVENYFSRMARMG